MLDRDPDDQRDSRMLSLISQKYHFDKRLTTFNAVEKDDYELGAYSPGVESNNDKQKFGVKSNITGLQQVKVNELNVV